MFDFLGSFEINRFLKLFKQKIKGIYFIDNLIKLRSLNDANETQARTQGGMHRVHVHPPSPHLIKSSAQSDQMRQNTNNRKGMK